LLLAHDLALERKRPRNERWIHFSDDASDVIDLLGEDRVDERGANADPGSQCDRDDSAQRGQEGDGRLDVGQIELPTVVEP